MKREVSLHVSCQRENHPFCVFERCSLHIFKGVCVETMPTTRLNVKTLSAPYCFTAFIPTPVILKDMTCNFWHRVGQVLGPVQTGLRANYYVFRNFVSCMISLRCFKLAMKRIFASSNLGMAITQIFFFPILRGTC